MIRPDFSGSDRDYSEPAERIDTGDYAVDRNPSDIAEDEGDGNDDDKNDTTDPDTTDSEK